MNNLKQLGERLIDIHSQHQTLQLVDDTYQFQVIDALANNKSNVLDYQKAYATYQTLEKELKVLVDSQADLIKEHDYNSFLLNELNEVDLDNCDLQVLEETYETLNNIEEIQEGLAQAHNIINDDEIGVSTALFNLKSITSKLLKYATKYQDVHTRVESVSIELDDIFNEIENLQSSLEIDPEQFENVSNKLQIINGLLKKHLVLNVSDLIEIRNNLEEKVRHTDKLEDLIEGKKQAVKNSKVEVDAIAKKINRNREEAIPVLKSQLESILEQLGMPNAKFKISVQYSDRYFEYGKDILSFLFTANKGGTFNELKKAASGGELSRIMLAIKSILSNYVQLPSIMFDEIDTGVSGEVSNKMADIMLKMSQKMQVFTITHLPQIAAKGNTHFKVYKEDVDNITQSGLKQLNHDERIVEIAQMLGGKEISTSAVAHAKQLLN